MIRFAPYVICEKKELSHRLTLVMNPQSESWLYPVYYIFTYLQIYPNHWLVALFVWWGNIDLKIYCLYKKQGDGINTQIKIFKAC